MSDNEYGYSICRDKGGKLRKGPTTHGTSHNVDIPLRCPAGTKLAGVHHHHPGGSLSLSEQDRAAARKHNLEHICIKAAGKTKCYKFKTKGRADR